MSLGKEFGEFSFKLTSVTLTEDGANVLNYDGTATGFGTVLGTLTARGEPDTSRGTMSWVGQGFLDNGTVIVGTAQGTYEMTGKHKWRVRGINQTSDGQNFASDGTIDLASRTYVGKLIEWT